MKVPFLLVMTGALALAPVGLANAAPASTETGQVVLIQAAPGMDVSFSVDGKMLRKSAHVGSEMGPYRLSAGRHQVQFKRVSGGAPMSVGVVVRPGSNSDVVLHFPAQSGGKPVINTYSTPIAAIGPGKARLLLAHTATVAPADVQFDGKTVFRDIANGEFAQAEVPDGNHEVALLPSGVKAKPILGPLDVDLKQHTVTMVYAVGSPTDGSMNVIKHTVKVASNGTVAPQRIKTGSAGLAADVTVTPFSAAKVPTVRTIPASWLTTVLRGTFRLGAATAP